MLTVALDPASEADLDGVLALLARAELPTADLTSVALRDFIVARDTETVVGTVALVPYAADGLLRSLAVDPGWRGHGIGGALLEAAELGAERRGLRALWLLTMDDAGEFFGQRGYEPAERSSAPVALQASSQFLSLCPASAACMVKRIA
jgi:amino-acid N-acetyltransferase